MMWPRDGSPRAGGGLRFLRS